MEIWLESEIRIRRDDALESARACRLACLAQNGRSTGFRIRIANGAQAVSDVLAALARALRGERPGQAARR
jgi:hypothetical protein